MRTGFTTLIRGQHESLATQLLPDTGYHKGINTSIRNGMIQTRPSWERLPITFPEGAFKGSLFVNRNEDSRLCVVVGQTPVLVDLESLEIVETFTGQFETDFDRAYLCDAEHAIIVQNGEDRAMVHLTTDTYDKKGKKTGSTTEVKRMNEDAGELPVGTFMAYVHGRIYVATDKRLFKAGDSFIDTEPENFLTFSETDYVNGGGAFGLPASLGDITGFAYVANAGTTGAGPLQVHTSGGVSTFNIHAARYLWGEIDISALLYSGPGCVADRSFVQSNNDLLFRSNDGIRSLGFTASTERNPNGLAFRDLSSEVKPSLVTDDSDSIALASMATADERVCCTVHHAGVIFKALAMLDVAPATTITSPASPSWDGIWTGIDVHQVVSVIRNGKAEVVAIGEIGGVLGIFILNESQLKDNNTTLIKSRVYTKAYNFDTNDVKTFEYAEVSVSAIQTAATLKVYYRPAGYPLWAELDTHSILVPEGGLSQPRRKIRFSAESMAVPYNPITEEKLTSGESFEFCLEWTGRLQVESFVVAAREGVEEFVVAKSEQESQSVVVGQHGIELNDLDYEVT